MKSKTRYILLGNVLLIVSMLLFIPAEPRTYTIQSSQYELVYIYNSDLTIAKSYKNYFEKIGWTVELVNSSNLDNGNWSSYQLIVLGHDTGSHYSWSNSSKVSYLDSLGIPFLATGLGSVSFYSELKLADEWGSSAIGSGTNVTAYNQTSPFPIFTSPNSVNVVNATIFTSPQSCVEYYIGGGINSTVDVIALNSVESNYAPLAVQFSRYGTWGFEGSPLNWTTQGFELFQNFVVFLTGSNPLTVSSSSSSTSTTTTSTTDSPLSTISPSSSSNQKANTSTITTTNFSMIPFLVVGLVFFSIRRRFKK